MHRIIATLVLASTVALSGSAEAARRPAHRPVCVAAAVEGVPLLICARPRRR